MSMLHVQLLVLLLTRICAKRKTRINGKVKWFSIVDILFIQNTYDPAYWAAWVIWCFWWDIYDRKYYKVAGGMGCAIVGLRTLWVMQTKTLIYIPAVLSSMGMTYASFYVALF